VGVPLPVLLLIVSAAPCVRSAAPLDTLWFGGRDPVTGLAVPGGVWDFEDGAAQGWTSADLTFEPVFFTHVTADSHAAHGDPASCVIGAAGSTGSMWCGAHEDYARGLCWPGGQGYSNHWFQELSKRFIYGGSGDVTLEFDYFVDSEEGYDFTYVYVRDAAGGMSEPLNTSANPDADGRGYSGSVPEGSNIGTPTAPAHDTIVIPESLLPDSPGEPFDIVFRFDSDPLVSDGRDEYSGYLDTIYGACGADNITVTGETLDDQSDFEPTGVAGEETDGWIPWVWPATGTLMRVRPLGEIDPIEDPEGCRLEEFVLLAANTDEGALPHPPRQHERLISNTIPLPDPGSFDTLVLRFDGYFYEPTMAYPCDLQVGLYYYPWICPETGEAMWNPDLTLSDLPESPRCRRATVDLTDQIPSGSDAPESLKVVFEYVRVCPGDEFCNSNDPTLDNPYWDNLRLGFTQTALSTDPGIGPASAPRATALLGGAPNAFNRGTTIRYTLAQGCAVRIAIYDLGGTLVRTLATGRHEGAGAHAVRWDGTRDDGARAASGIYFVRLEAGDAVEADRIALAR
jgi:hypothetical protein